MEVEFITVVGQVAGIGGITTGVFFFLYRDIIRKKIFPKLPPAEAYRLLRLITLAIWSLAVIGIVAWFVGDRAADSPSINGIISNSGDTIQSGEGSINVISKDSTINVSD